MNTFMSFVKSKSFYYRMAQITPITVYILMMLGSYVKSIGARVSCPDWPLCYDQVFPWNVPANSGFTIDQVMAEYIHRLFALLVVFFILFVFYLSYVHRNDMNLYKEPMGMKRFQLMILVTLLLGLQVIAGALTVLIEENIIVSVHLAVATLILSGTIIHAIWIKHPSLES